MHAPILLWQIFWPVYPQSFTETFSNVALSLYELLLAGWIERDAQLLPHAAWFAETWLQPFSNRRVRPIQQLSSAVCFRSGAVCHLGSFTFDPESGAGKRGPPRRPWETMQYIASHKIGRRVAGAHVPWWRRAPLTPPAIKEVALRIVFVVRKGRRKLRNAEELAAACDVVTRVGSSDGVTAGIIESARRTQSTLNLRCSTHSFGEGWARDLQHMRDTDVLVGSHGADLVNALAMPSGSSVVEARPFLFVPILRKWSCFYADLCAMDGRVHHYALQLGAVDTVGLEKLMARYRAKLSAHHTWNSDMILPQRMLDRAVSVIVGVRGDAKAYVAKRAAGQTVLWSENATTAAKLEDVTT